MFLFVLFLFLFFFLFLFISQHSYSTTLGFNMSHLQNPHAAAPISGNNYQDNASTLYPNSDAAPISSNNYNQQSRTDYYHQNGDGNGSVDVNGAPLKQTQSSLSISPALFEKLYLSPQNAVKGDLRKTFGNPTPLYVWCFSVYSFVHSFIDSYDGGMRGVCLCVSLC